MCRCFCPKMLGFSPIDTLDTLFFKPHIHEKGRIYIFFSVRDLEKSVSSVSEGIFALFTGVFFSTLNSGPSVSSVPRGGVDLHFLPVFRGVSGDTL